MVGFIKALEIYDKAMGTKDSFEIPKESKTKIKNDELVVDIDENEEKETTKARDEPKEEMEDNNVSRETIEDIEIERNEENGI